jgi:hypothetical protein
MLTAIVLAIFLAPWIAFLVMIIIRGREQQRLDNEKADYILRSGVLPRSKS